MNPTGRVLVPVLVLATAVALLLANPRLEGRGSEGPGRFADLARRLKPTVVNLQVTRPAPPLPPGHPSLGPGPDQENREGEDPRREDDGEGSGLVLDPKGLILTNHHVVAGAQRIDVFLADQTRLPGRLVGSDASTDLALVQVRPLRPRAPQLRQGAHLAPAALLRV